MTWYDLYYFTLNKSCLSLSESESESIAIWIIWNEFNWKSIPKYIFFTKEMYLKMSSANAQIANPWGQHGAHLGPVGLRWAPCWPHEPCYQGGSHFVKASLCQVSCIALSVCWTKSARICRIISDDSVITVIIGQWIKRYRDFCWYTEYKIRIPIRKLLFRLFCQCWYTELSINPGYFRKPHWLSMGHTEYPG